MAENLKIVGDLKFEECVLTSYTLNGAKVDELGGIKLFNENEITTIASDKNYAVQLSDDNKAYVHVPVTDDYEFTSGLKCENHSVSVVMNDLVYTNTDNVVVLSNKLSVKIDALTEADENKLGGIKLFNETERTALTSDNNYAVQLSDEGKAYVNVVVPQPKEYTFSDGLSCENDSVSVVMNDLVYTNDNVVVLSNKLSVQTYTLGEAKEGELGGIKLFNTEEKAQIKSSNNYAVQLSSNNKAYVNIVIPEQKEYTFTNGLSCKDYSVSVILSDLVYTNDNVTILSSKLSIDINGALPKNTASKVISTETEYTKSNILSDYVLSVNNTEYPTLNEIWTALSTVIDILGGKITQKGK